MIFNKVEVFKFARKWSFVIILGCVACLLYVLGHYSNWIEHQYATGWYRQIAIFYRSVTGIIPFSAGDVLYYSAAVLIIFCFIHLVVKLFLHGKVFLKSLKVGKMLRQLAIGLLCIYIVFKINWGLNYNRFGIGYKMGLDTSHITKTDLIIATDWLAAKIDEDKEQLSVAKQQDSSARYVIKETVSAYNLVQSKFTFLEYKAPSLKPSLMNSINNHGGYTGYYNPFTGEAQVNFSIPFYEQPFVSCHEVAHQLGYAKELEANFAGYLSAIASREKIFQYSAHMAMFRYCLRNLYRADFNTAVSIKKSLSQQVRLDMDRSQQFYAQFDSGLQTVFSGIYEQYLLNNNQPDGLLSYDAATLLLIAYYKKYGYQ